MEKPVLIPVTIAGTGHYVPERVLTNADLENMVDTSDEWIRERTGILERRIAGDSEFTSHMATEASKRALEAAGMQAEELDMIIMATITPDTPTPATSCYVQENLGAVNAIAYDISAACSGYLYAMRIAATFIGSGLYKNILIVAAEKLSTVVNWEDRSTCVLFGDGSGAAVLRPAKEGEGRILATDMGADGSQHQLLNIPGGGSARPITTTNVHERLATLAMKGNEVFKHAVTRMKNSANKVIELANLQPEEINMIIPHQANLRIINAIASRLTIPEDRIFVNVHKYGNTSAASIGIAMDEAIKAGKLKKGDNVILVAFGAGFTWASAAIQM